MVNLILGESIIRKSNAELGNKYLGYLLVSCSNIGEYSQLNCQNSSDRNYKIMGSI